MATLALSLAGQVVGGLFGGPIGATVGRALGALAGSAVDGAIFGDNSTASQGSDVRLQGSSEGGAIPRLYGWNRVSGNIIWARELEVLAAENSGAKGFGAPQEADEIGASFAVALGEGDVQVLGRIWADGQLLDPSDLNFRFYSGSENQMPDSLIEATQAPGAAPAYRGLCYIVFEQLPLSRFGNHIPQFSVELCRVVGELEADIRAVTVIPGATEYGYDPSPRLQMLGPGHTRGENSHVLASQSDWSVSIDQLQALCPNLEHVALVVAWFGDDLRCGHCAIGPRVESAERAIADVNWQVAGLGRGDVPVVSQHGGGAAYGGTPADSAVKAAIADLKARDIKVTLYPIILMDCADYPWRGRISCDPVPGAVGTPDQTSGVNVQISDFVGNYRKMFLHYAQLAADAGGVEALLIGSEMVGMTTLRGAGNSFPFVAALVDLAADVRAIVGVTTKLTYAADWSEYSGYQPAGEKFFHLDPLWASPHIDAIGIDNYMPIADWRDGEEHPDKNVANSPYELNYLMGNIAGGEGYDWYYASAADRLAAIRTPISDGAGEPWVWRFKDLANWWGNYHYNRPAGVRASVATAWVPGSKSIWFTELGCGAVDKGANQPNKFADAKSLESGLPYFSNGNPDALMQRQFLRAQQKYWRIEANNPAGMVDIDRLYLWTWDARPFPAFPGLADVWRDGVNYATGHWLTGRLGGLASDELAEAIARDYGVSLNQIGVNGPLVQGYQLSRAGTCREALEPVLKASGQYMRDSAQGLAIIGAKSPNRQSFATDELVREQRPILRRKRQDTSDTPGQLALSYIDREHDYLRAGLTAIAHRAGALAGESSALVLDMAAARQIAERLLALAGPQVETVEFSVPPSAAALEIGDLIAFANLEMGRFQITEIRDGLARRVVAHSLPNPAPMTIVAPKARQIMRTPAARTLPLVRIAHLPPAPGDISRSRLAIAAFAQPWPGNVSVADAASGVELARLTRRGGVGVAQSALQPGPIAVWDAANSFDIQLYAGHVANIDPQTLLAGGNRLAVQNDAGQWEIIGFAQAELIGPQTYRLTQLLRGLDGTDAAMGGVARGNAVLVLDQRVQIVPVDAQWLGGGHDLQVFAGNNDVLGTPLHIDTIIEPILPLAPVHLQARREVSSGDVLVDWVRRSRADDNNWVANTAPLELVPETYQVTILEGLIVRRTLQSGAPSWRYSLAQQNADFGSVTPNFSYQIAQISPIYGPGHSAKGRFDG